MLGVRKDHEQHFFFGLGIMAVLFIIGIILRVTNADLIGYAAAIAFFWGRERRDFEMEYTKEHKTNLAAIDYKFWFPWQWSRDCILDWVFPFISASCLLIIIRLVQYFFFN